MLFYMTSLVRKYNSFCKHRSFKYKMVLSVVDYCAMWVKVCASRITDTTGTLKALI